MFKKHGVFVVVALALLITQLWATPLRQQKKGETAQEEREKKTTELSEDDLSMISKILARTATEEKDGDMLQRSIEERQAGDRRLKCILYDRNTGKCLRHKLKFVWGK